MIVMDRFTNTIAVPAAVSTWWAPSLSQIDSDATRLLTFLGIAWLAVQIIWRVTGRDRDRRDD